MPANFNAPTVSKLAISQHMKVQNGGPAPSGNEKVISITENDAIRIVIGGETLYYLSGRCIYDCKSIRNVLRHINELAVRCDCDARRIARACIIGRLRLSECEFLRYRRAAIFPGVNEERIGVAAGDIECVALRREGRAVKCAVLQQRLRDLARLEVDDLNTLFAPAPQYHHSLVAARAGYDVKRHAAKLNHGTDRIQAYAGR